MDHEAPRNPEREEARLQVAAAVVWRDGLLLMTQRPPGGPLGLQWEFPGGKIEPGESPEQALAREIREELNVGAKTGEVLAVDLHRYDHGLEVEIWFIACELDSRHLVAGGGVHDMRWWDLDQIDLSQVLEGDRRFLRELRRGERRPSS
ncbi:MAG: NUDIX domain-containing protein [Candidatus Eisenbacteria bacterium]|uniref:8-oxo-dGTP diphosphatase n=1 Tax=Eiseniibacteriota bacterium TaxID=2212470 RepID=A0A538UBS4_UNCEI|nr:MAG: NUDIX domain-containing protein [Candidatus Eisenbacteria bacterium]